MDSNYCTRSETCDEMPKNEKILLKVGTKTFRAHKNVLMEQSKFFFDALKNHNPEKVFCLFGISTPLFEVILDWLYYHNTVITQENLKDICHCADHLGINGLFELCKDFVIDSLKCCNPAVIHELVQQTNHLDLCQLANDYLDEHFLEIAKGKHFVRFTKEQVIWFLSNDNIFISSETEVLDAAMRWLMFDWNSRKQASPIVLKQVRFGLMSQEELINSMETHNTDFILDMEECRQMLLDTLFYHKAKEQGKKTSDLNIPPRVNMGKCKPLQFYDTKYRSKPENLGDKNYPLSSIGNKSTYNNISTASVWGSRSVTQRSIEDSDISENINDNSINSQNHDGDKEDAVKQDCGQQKKQCTKHSPRGFITRRMQSDSQLSYNTSNLGDRQYNEYDTNDDASFSSLKETRRSKKVHWEALSPKASRVESSKERCQDKKISLCDFPKSHVCEGQTCKLHNCQCCQHCCNSSTQLCCNHSKINCHCCLHSPLPNFIPPFNTNWMPMQFPTSPMCLQPSLFPLAPYIPSLPYWPTPMAVPVTSISPASSVNPLINSQLNNEYSIKQNNLISNAEPEPLKTKPTKMTTEKQNSSAVVNVEESNVKISKISIETPETPNINSENQETLKINSEKSKEKNAEMKPLGQLTISTAVSCQKPTSKDSYDVKLQDSKRSISNVLEKRTELTAQLWKQIGRLEPPTILLLGGLNPMESWDTYDAGRQILHFDPVINKWSVVNYLVEPRHFAAAVIISDKIYITGGCNPNQAFNGLQLTPLDSVWCLNIRTGRWTALKNMLQSRMHHGTAVMNGKIYVVGGLSQNNKLLATVECYDPKYDKWEELNPLSRPCMGASVLAAFQKLWVCGGLGYDERGTMKQLFNTVECYSNDQGWIAQNPLRFPCCFSILEEFEGSLYLVGGATCSEQSEKLVSTAVISRYDASVDMWMHCSELLLARHNCSSALLGHTLYIFGGITSEGTVALPDVEWYDLKSKISARVQPLPRPLCGMSSVVIKSSQKIF